MRSSRTNTVLWIVAIVLTIASAAYQRLTGPTYPVSVSATLGQQKLAFNLPRSHGGEGDHEIRLIAPGENLRAALVWKRYNTGDSLRHTAFLRSGDTLLARIPHQPPAGKIVYHVQLTSGDAHATLPPEGNVVIRFKGDVPATILVPHIVLMFLAMLFSMRAGLECFVREPHVQKLTLATLGFLIVGGAILGPLVQKFAFGAYWTGWPYGTDLTDNKTLIALIGWVAAAIAVFTSRRPRWWVVGAAMLLFAVYLIPHSLFGSELDYNKTATQQSVGP
jgi:hypothetical protein